MRRSSLHWPRRGFAPRVAWIAICALVVGATSVGPASAHRPAQRPTTIDIYLSTTGDDGNNGTADHPVKSLARARDLASGVSTDEATIHVGPGTYFETRTIIWDGVPQGRIRVRPTDAADDRPVFDGSQVPLVDVGRHSWMRTGETGPGPSLDVRGMTVRNYGTSGLRLYHVDNNIVRDMIFEDLGNVHVPGATGYAALHVTDSNNNMFANNIYRHLENSDCPGCIHAIYPSQSSNNQITGSRMEYITGDPVRLRNDSHNNVVKGNLFQNNSFPEHPDRAMVSFWLFTASEVCGSHNRVDKNTSNGRFYDGRPGLKILGSGAADGLAACTEAVTGRGNRLVDDQVAG